jgi:hypothetical protein
VPEQRELAACRGSVSGRGRRARRTPSIHTSATLYDAEAFQAPQAPGVRFHDVFGVWIGGSGGLNSVVNGVGGPVTSTNPGKVEPVDVASYP